MAEFVLDFRLTQDDWKKYRRCYTKRFQSRQGGLFASSSSVYGLIFITGLVLTFIVGVLQKLGVAGGGSPVGVVVGFGVGVAAVLIWAVAWSHRIEQWGENEEGGYVLGQRRLTANDEGVDLVGANYRTHFGWRAFEDFTENGGMALLWLDRGAAVIVPSSAFGDMLVRRAFLELARRKIRDRPSEEIEHAFA
jgi:hypothetical protein